MYYVLFGVALLFYWGSAPQGERLGDEEGGGLGLVNVSVDRLADLHIARDGEWVRCRQERGRWRVMEPAGAWLPADLVSSFVITLVETKAVEVIETQGEVTRTFGFERGTRVQLYERGHDVPVTVVLGGRTPTQTAMYARADDTSRVLVVGRVLQDYVDRMFDELHRQRPTGFEPRDGGPGAAGKHAMRR